VAFCVFTNINTQFLFLKDSLTQKAFIQDLRSTDDIRQNNTFSFVYDKNLWARGRQIRFYEFSGFFRNAFNDQTRFGSESSQTYLSKKQIYYNSKYNLENYYPSEKLISLKLSRPLEFNNYKIFKLTLKHIFQGDLSKDEFKYFINLKRI
jgi:hypothetical protein